MPRPYPPMQTTRRHRSPHVRVARCSSEGVAGNEGMTHKIRAAWPFLSGPAAGQDRAPSEGGRLPPPAPVAPLTDRLVADGNGRVGGDEEASLLPPLGRQALVTPRPKGFPQQA